MPLYAFAGFTVGIVGAVPSVMIAVFPPQVRFSGISFSYNVSYAVFGWLTPILIFWLLHFDTLLPAQYVGALSLLGCGIRLFLLCIVRHPTMSRSLFRGLLPHS